MPQPATEGVVHMQTLPHMQFSDELLVLSYKYRLSLLHTKLLWVRRNHFHGLFRVLPSRGIVVERSHFWASLLITDCFWQVGFNLMSSQLFFLFSPPSRLGLAILTLWPAELYGFPAIQFLCWIRNYLSLSASFPTDLLIACLYRNTNIITCCFRKSYGSQ